MTVLFKSMKKRISPYIWGAVILLILTAGYFTLQVFTPRSYTINIVSHIISTNMLPIPVYDAEGNETGEVKSITLTNDYAVCKTRISKDTTIFQEDDIRLIFIGGFEPAFQITRTIPDQTTVHVAGDYIWASEPPELSALSTNQTRIFQDLINLYKTPAEFDAYAYHLSPSDRFLLLSIITSANSITE